MLRFVPVFLCLGLAVLWVVGLCLDASVWLTWTVGTQAVAALATAGLVSDRQGNPLAALCLALVGAGLLILWLAGLQAQATPWLTWWSLVGAGLSLGGALALAGQGLLDRIRVRPLL